MSEKKTCFIIRPFSKLFDTRSDNIYKPAIIAANLEPVEAGVPGNDKITDEIENGIRNAAICLADLTPQKKKDKKGNDFYSYNFNVWYELGFALACHRRAVMLFNTGIWTMESLPFDIKHRFVIGYRDSVDSDNLAQLGITGLITKDLQEKLRQIENSSAQLSKGKSHAASKSTVAASDNGDLSDFDIKVLEKIVDLQLQQGTLDSPYMDSYSNITASILLEHINNEGYYMEQGGVRRIAPKLGGGANLDEYLKGESSEFSRKYRNRSYEIKDINLSLMVLIGDGYVSKNEYSAYSATGKAIKWYRARNRKEKK